jgi:hypothetical protein
MSPVKFINVREPPAWVGTALVGADLASVECFGDYGWTFGLGDHCTITTDSLWRLVTPTGIVVTSEDHRHSLGLPNPIDAIGIVMASVTLGMRVTTYSISPLTADIKLDFGSLASLEIISTSCGYERWHLRARLNSEAFEIVAQGGGQFAVPE